MDICCFKIPLNKSRVILYCFKATRRDSESEKKDTRRNFCWVKMLKRRFDLVQLTSTNDADESGRVSDVEGTNRFANFQLGIWLDIQWFRRLCNIQRKKPLSLMAKERELKLNCQRTWLLRWELSGGFHRFSRLKEMWHKYPRNRFK